MTETLNLEAGEFRYQDAFEALFALRDDTSATPTLIGHFAVFDQWTEINSRFEGHFIERIAPTAFDKTFAENRRNMRVLFQHGKDPQIGEKILGPIAELRAEGAGAYYEVPLYDTSYNRDLLPGLADNQYGASFRFRAVKEDWVDSPKRSEHNPDGLRERTITEAKVMEFGPVTFPAYEGSTAGLRSATDWYVEQALRNQLELLVTKRDSTLEEPQHSQVEAPIVTPEPSRSTRVDHLSTIKEDAPWRL
jgi:HK97 family phage prohead protease